METFLSLLVGVGLSAACGFRLFVPLLVLSIASRTGHLHLAAGFEWMGSTPALIAFATATALEIAAYYVPWVDNLLDTVASPAAVIAGTLVTASLVTDMSPFLKWTLAVIAGGGIAGLVQGTTVIARGASSAGTGGFANPILATAELGGSLATSILALVAPAFVVVAVAGLLLLVGWKVIQRRQNRPAKT
jgi:hypothetical protein